MFVSLETHPPFETLVLRKLGIIRMYRLVVVSSCFFFIFCKDDSEMLRYMTFSWAKSICEASFMQKCCPSLSCAYCIFAKFTIPIFRSPNCSSHG